MDNKDKGNAHIGLGAVSLTLGMVKVAYPSEQPPTGRWSLIFGPLFDSFGPMGPAIAFVAIGFLLVIFGFFLRSKK
jgi:hypothetical protein